MRVSQKDILMILISMAMRCYFLLVSVLSMLLSIRAQSVNVKKVASHGYDVVT